MKVEWEVTMKCNYSCFYCTNLDQSLKAVDDESEIRQFIKMLGEKYPGVEVFVFGGEPFLHPKINYIIECFNEFSIPFVIQTNFSKKSLSVMKKISSPFKVQISIHPTEVKLEHLPFLFDSNIDVRVIDVMYSSRQAIKYYFKVKELAKNVQHIFLTPIADFGDGISSKLLEDYNQLRYNSNYNKFIQFEEVKHWGKFRSELWSTFTPKGKPCLYSGKYFLYGPDLKLYNCCYRENHAGICNHDKCFLM
jgi:organic radical activating enzyme